MKTYTREAAEMENFKLHHSLDTLCTRHFDQYMAQIIKEKLEEVISVYDKVNNFPEIHIIENQKITKMMIYIYRYIPIYLYIYILT